MTRQIVCVFAEVAACRRRHHKPWLPPILPPFDSLLCLTTDALQTIFHSIRTATFVQFDRVIVFPITLQFSFLHAARHSSASTSSLPTTAQLLQIPPLLGHSNCLVYATCTTFYQLWSYSSMGGIDILWTVVAAIGYSFVILPLY